jgi:prepilin-type N-terminal cleavage/methylation domain-containing protein
MKSMNVFKTMHADMVNQLAKKWRENADMKNSSSVGYNDKNKGFSLIELLVVIAIMGIFIGVSFASIGLIQSGNMTSVTKSIATGIQETRQKTMTQNLAYGWSFSVNTDSQGNVSMTITKNGANAESTANTVTELKKCTLYYSKNTDAEKQITDFKVVFDAATGAIKSLEYVSSDGSVITQNSGSGTIRAAHGKKESELTIFFATGKYEVNKR